MTDFSLTALPTKAIGVIPFALYTRYPGGATARVIRGHDLSRVHIHESEELPTSFTLTTQAAVDLYNSLRDALPPELIDREPRERDTPMMPGAACQSFPAHAAVRALGRICVIDGAGNVHPHDHAALIGFESPLPLQHFIDARMCGVNRFFPEPTA